MKIIHHMNIKSNSEILRQFLNTKTCGYSIILGAREAKIDQTADKGGMNLVEPPPFDVDRGGNWRVKETQGIHILMSMTRTLPLCGSRYSGRLYELYIITAYTWSASLWL